MKRNKSRLFISMYIRVAEVVRMREGPSIRYFASYTVQYLLGKKCTISWYILHTILI